MNTETQTQVLKVSLRYWVQQVGFVFVYAVIVPVLVFFYWGGGSYLVGIIIVLMGIFIVLRNIYFAFKSSISISLTEISGNINGEDFKLPWTAIDGVRFSDQSNIKTLTLFAEADGLNIPYQYFDEKLLMQLLQAHLPANLFQPNAYQKSAEFIEWKHDTEAQFASLPQPLKVSLDASGVFIGILFLGGGLIISGVLYFSDHAQSFSAWILPLILSVIGLLLVFLSPGWVEATNETISMYTILRRYTFAWRDIREVYISLNQSIVALVGDESRFVIPNPSRWSGKDKAQLAELINYKLEISGIEPIKSRKVYYWRSKNAPF